MYVSVQKRESRQTCECSWVNCLKHVCPAMCLYMGVSCQRTSEGYGCACLRSVLYTCLHLCG